MSLILLTKSDSDTPSLPAGPLAPMPALSLMGFTSSFGVGHLFSSHLASTDTVIA